MLNQLRIERAQALMAKHGMDALLILTHDDYVYFFDEDRFQPRAIIPREGQPIVVAFTAEADDLKQSLGVSQVKVFSSVGQQMKDVVGVMKELTSETGPKPKIGLQLSWFEVPAVLVGLFQRLNPSVEIVDLAPVMDELRLVKEPGELERMTRAAEIAGIGVRAALAAIREGVTENEVAAEAEYAMRKAGASGVAVPVYVNSGERSLWLHGAATDRVIRRGDLIVLDLVPRYRGYLANLARTAVVGEPTPDQRRLFDAYRAAQTAAISTLRAGERISRADRAAQAEVAKYGLGDLYVNGISHGIGLRFEELPAPTIHPSDSSFVLREGMTVTAGHSVLAVPGIGGVRIEDTGLVGPDGWRALMESPAELFVVE